MSSGDISPGIVLRMLINTEVWTYSPQQVPGLNEPDHAFRLARIASIAGVHLENAVSVLEQFPDVFQRTDDPERWQIVDRDRLVQLERSWGRVYGNYSYLDVPTERSEAGYAARERFHELWRSDPYLFGMDICGEGREYTAIKDPAFVCAVQAWISRGEGSVADVLAKVPNPPGTDPPDLAVS